MSVCSCGPLGNEINYSWRNEQTICTCTLNKEDYVYVKRRFSDHLVSIISTHNDYVSNDQFKHLNSKLNFSVSINNNTGLHNSEKPHYFRCDQ